MTPSEHIIYVVDDDLRMRESIQNLLASYGRKAMVFASAAEYIESPKPDLAACLVLDVELPDMNGLELQRQLAGAQHPPIVFITGHGDIPRSVRAMKAGAVDFLAKPFRVEDFLAAIDSAVTHDRQARATVSELNVLRERHESLTPREREVLPLIVSGLLNKQAAARLGISVVTLQIHRGNIMRKMAAGSLTDLVRMSTKLGIPVYERCSVTAAKPGVVRSEWSKPGPTCS